MENFDFTQFISFDSDMPYEQVKNIVIGLFSNTDFVVTDFDEVENVKKDYYSEYWKKYSFELKKDDFLGDMQEWKEVEAPPEDFTDFKKRIDPLLELGVTDVRLLICSFAEKNKTDNKVVYVGRNHWFSELFRMSIYSVERPPSNLIIVVEDYNKVGNQNETMVQGKKVIKLEEYVFSCGEKDIMIKAGQVIEDSRRIVYCAYTNFENISTFDECKEKALKKCMERIEFAMLRLKKDVKLLKWEQAADLAQTYFKENYTNKEILGDSHLKFFGTPMIEDELLTHTIFYYDVRDRANGRIYNVAIVYVNLLTGECSMIENKS